MRSCTTVRTRSPWSARFLALLELYRESAVVFEQLDALAELHVRWVGTDEGDLTVDDEFDVTAPPDDADGPASDDETEASDRNESRCWARTLSHRHH